MIMKKLYTRNKDLETAVGKAQTKIKEVKRNTTQNFFQNAFKENEGKGDQATDLDLSKTPNNDNTMDPELDEEDSEIEIGCKECDKYRSKEKQLNQELDKKIKYIFELENKVSRCTINCSISMRNMTLIMPPTISFFKNGYKTLLMKARGTSTTTCKSGTCTTTFWRQELLRKEENG